MNTQRGFADSVEFKSDNGNYYVTGYLSVANVIDKVGDIVTQACLTDMAAQLKGLTGNAVFSSTLKGSVEHEGLILADPRICPISKAIGGDVEGNRLRVDTILNKYDPNFDAVWKSIEGGFLNAFSIEYIPERFSFEERNGERVRLLDKVKLIGYAHTGRPANDYCTLKDAFIKSIENKKLGDKMSEETTPQVNDKPIEPVAPVVEAKTEVVLPVEAPKVDLEKVKLEAELVAMKSKIAEFEKKEELNKQKEEIKSIVKEALKELQPQSKALVEQTEKFEAVKPVEFSFKSAYLKSKGA
jgi:hypothetical protein